MKEYKLVIPRQPKVAEVKHPPMPVVSTVKLVNIHTTLIQGQTADSVQEIWVAKALVKLREPFIYHYVILGGSEVREGQIVDFLLTRLVKPVQVFGEYWHRALSAEDAYNLAMLEQYFGNTPTVLWGVELQSEEESFTTVRRRLYL